jgi:aryl-alcohol dehydrogenase-like predicted oxidoreductase
MSKLALGTVQFGLAYGVSNATGKVSTKEVGKILTLAKKAGISLLDTAQAYGDSESVLGTKAYTKICDVVSKIPPHCAISDFTNQVKTSLNHLQIVQLYGLLLHQGDTLLGEHGKAIYQQLVKIKQQDKLCKKIGCSLYCPQQAISISRRYKLDLMQLPANLFDQRIFANNTLAILKQQGIEIHVRSLFLQGALFIPCNELPEHLLPLKPILTKIHALVGTNKQDLIAYALAPFIQNKAIDKIVIGCCSSQELAEIIAAYEQAHTINYPFQFCAIDDENIILPSNWPQ